MKATINYDVIVILYNDAYVELTLILRKICGILVIIAGIYLMIK